MKRVLGILVLAAWAIGASGAAFSEPLTILTENSGDNNYLAEDGSIKGHNVDLVREIMARLGVKSRIQLLPWKRAYMMARGSGSVALFSTTRTHAREKMFKWVGPLHVSKFVLYGRRGAGIRLKTLEDAKRLKGIGCYRDDVREQFLKARGFKNLESLYGSDANAINLRKVLLGRVDLWITSNKVMINTALHMGVDPYTLEEALVVKRIYAYIAFSRGTPDAVVSAWQTSLEEIKRDGAYQRIMLRYPTGKDSITYEPPRPAPEEK